MIYQCQQNAYRQNILEQNSLKDKFILNIWERDRYKELTRGGGQSEPKILETSNFTSYFLSDEAANIEIVWHSKFLGYTISKQK